MLESTNSANRGRWSRVQPRAPTSPNPPTPLLSGYVTSSLRRCRYAHAKTERIRCAQHTEVKESSSSSSRVGMKSKDSVSSLADEFKRLSISKLYLLAPNSLPSYQRAPFRGSQYRISRRYPMFLRYRKPFSSAANFFPALLSLDVY